MQRGRTSPRRGSRVVATNRSARDQCDPTPRQQSSGACRPGSGGARWGSRWSSAGAVLGTRGGAGEGLLGRGDGVGVLAGWLAGGGRDGGGGVGRLGGGA